MHYTIKHEDGQDISYKDIFPLICQHGIDRKLLHLKSDGEEQHFEDYMEDNEVLATMHKIYNLHKKILVLGGTRTRLLLGRPQNTLKNLGAEDGSLLRRPVEASSKSL